MTDDYMNTYAIKWFSIFECISSLVACTYTEYQTLFIVFNTFGSWQYKSRQLRNEIENHATVHADGYCADVFNE